MKFSFLNVLTPVVYFLRLSIVITLSTEDVDLTNEDKYVKQFGNKKDNTNEWYTIKQWFNETDQLKVRKLCAAAHRKMFGKGRYMIESLAYRNGTLSFISEKYKPMRVVFLEYGLRSKDIPLDVKNYINLDENDRWYVSQGLHKGCVFYLTLTNSTLMEFNLQEQICGLKHKY